MLVALAYSLSREINRREPMLFLSRANDHATESQSTVGQLGEHEAVQGRQLRKTVFARPFSWLITSLVMTFVCAAQRGQTHISDFMTRCVLALGGITLMRPQPGIPTGQRKHRTVLNGRGRRFDCRERIACVGLPIPPKVMPHPGTYSM